MGLGRKIFTVLGVAIMLKAFTDVPAYGFGAVAESAAGLLIAVFGR
jgi:hypothetical protein